MRVTLSLKMTNHGETFVLVQAPLELPAIDLQGDVLEDDPGPEPSYVQDSVGAKDGGELTPAAI